MTLLLFPAAAVVAAFALAAVVRPDGHGRRAQVLLAILAAAWTVACLLGALALAGGHP